MKRQRVVVVGLGKSGISALGFFTEREATIEAFDKGMKADEALMARFPKVNFHFETNPTGEEEADLVLMSPGIPLELEFVQKFLSRGIEVTGDIETAYQHTRSRFIAITGTNGKTTSTTLTGVIYQDFFDKVYVVGNIGNPILDDIVKFDEETYVIAELSSFQLESIRTYRPHIAAILNITEDHLNRHKTMENYVAAKFRIFENQEENDYLVLNYDDELLRNFEGRLKSKRIYFSRKEMLSEGVFVSGDAIVSILNGKEEHIMKVSEIALPGAHNLENVLACTAIALLSGVTADSIRKSVMSFRGVEHRLEYVREKDGVCYFNDSKATNPDSSIKAIEAIAAPIILIAGGMDKRSDFTEWIRTFAGKVKKMVLIGETRSLIEKQAKRLGFHEVEKVSNMKEAVEAAARAAVNGDTVLLSPACASWDMYPNYEVRGRDFKNHVNNL